jgi:hypothetical protein
MSRLRLTSLALASGLLVNLSGCVSYNPCSEPLFPRLSTWVNRPVTHAAPAECECHSSHLTPGMDFGVMQGPVFPGTVQGPVFPGTVQGPVFPGTVQGPQMIVPQPQQIPITNMPPVSQAPFKTPQAATFPYSPTN